MTSSAGSASLAAFRRITVVDDSPELLALFRDILGPRGVEMTTLGRGARFEDVKRSRPELIVVDLRLGTDHLPGWELVRLVRAHPDLERIPVIVCSGALDQVHDRGAAEIGLPQTYLLPKPFSLSDLESVLDEAARAAADEPAGTAADMELPGFAVDPFGWFDRIGAEIMRPGWVERCRRIEPAAWIGPGGHAWRVVRTARGIEVRPELVSPFLRFGDQPMVTALGLGTEVELELTTVGGRWVGRFSRDTLDVAALGRAMLEERGLPHDNLSRLFPPRRASGAQDASPTAFHIGPAAASTGAGA